MSASFRIIRIIPACPANKTSECYVLETGICIKLLKESHNEAVTSDNRTNGFFVCYLGHGQHTTHEVFGFPSQSDIYFRVKCIVKNYPVILLVQQYLLFIS